MIVHSIKQNIRGDECRISAQITYDRPHTNIPDRLWFNFPAQYAPAEISRGDAFLTALLLPAMCLGENIRIEGVVSPRLLVGLDTYRHTFCTWLPHLYPAQIGYAEASEAPGLQSGTLCASAFSGGVDSFFTLRSNLPDAQPLEKYRITHCLLAQGLDISLVDPQFDDLVRCYKKELSALGVELIPLRTNVHAFTTGRLDWAFAHGSALIALAQALGSSLARFYVPSSYCTFDLVPWGSSPVIDHLLSTETLEVIHHAAGVQRLQKLETISDLPVAQRSLRVCTNDKKRRGVENCGVCEKCLRTMTMLKVIGKLDAFETFPKPFPAWRILTWVPEGEIHDYWASSSIRYTRCNHRRGLLPFLWFAHLTGWLKDFLRSLIPAPVLKFLKRYLYPPEKSSFSHAYLERFSSEEDRY